VSGLVLAACGGGDSNATIGGTLTGLTTGLNVVLEDNASSSITLTSDGTFTFGDELGTGDTYDVTVTTQPVGETCTVANGSGTVNAVDNVSDIAVTCAVTASVTGTVSGLAAGTSVTLSNGSVLLPIAANGSFSFPGVLASGSAYAVTIAVSPVGETCTVGNGSGTVPASEVVSVAVVCS
jgi:hypothetical protein